jgi:hypothetical protein
MTAHQKYRIIKKYEGFEAREYLSCIVADVTVESDRDSAGNIGFRPLVKFISDSSIAMTAPVIQEEAGKGKWRITFVMPAGAELADLPMPTDSQVTLRTLPAHTAAAMRFNGRTTEATITTREKQLRELIELNNLQAQGTMRVARFDPPWKMPISRHNEIIIPIAD